MDLLRVGITHGDFNGIGYEVILKAIADPMITELLTPVIFGIPSVAEKCRMMLGLTDMKLNIINDPADIEDGKINLISITQEEIIPTPGIVSKEAGEFSVEALEQAAKALQNGDIDVLVTAPISKEATQSDRFPFPGHTEFLESRLGTDEKALMVLCNNDLRVALLTIHIPIAKVAESVTAEKISASLDAFSHTLKQDFGCERPSIAVLALNPHSGDGGVIGDEEENIIKPILEEKRREGILAFGPYAADGFFGHGSYKNFDGVLAMYHDQGLAPFKTIATSGGVNFTAGIPYVRTSPDHGTAFDIAWQNLADEQSMRDAIYMAIDIYRNRSSFEESSANPLKKHVADKPDRGERQERPLKFNSSNNDTHD